METKESVVCDQKGGVTAKLQHNKNTYSKALTVAYQNANIRMVIQESWLGFILLA